VSEADRSTLDGNSADPLKILKQSIEAVPAVRFALGVVGVAAGASLVRAYFSSTRGAVYATVAMLVLMVLLWIFAQLVRISPKSLKYPTLILAWAVFVVAACLPFVLISSVCFDWPKPFTQFRALFSPVQSTATVTEDAKTPEFAGTITDALTHQTLEGVSLRAGWGSALITKTDSNGYFEFSLPKYASGRVAISFEKDGYEMMNESVLPSKDLDFAMNRSMNRSR
jgi:hypothetical protein